MKIALIGYLLSFLFLLFASCSLAVADEREELANISAKCDSNRACIIQNFLYSKN